jgi:hypothetical protein
MLMKFFDICNLSNIMVTKSERVKVADHTQVKNKKFIQISIRKHERKMRTVGG